jgi:hypothetical protein
MKITKVGVVAISPGSLLSLNSLSVAPLAEAMTGGFRLRCNSQAIDIAGQLNADRQRQEAEKLNRSPTLVAFDAKGRFVETILHVRNALDVFL